LTFPALIRCSTLLAFSSAMLYGQVVAAGAGSYTTALPAGATAPQSTIFRTFAGPVPTHKFWTAKNWYPQQNVTGSGPYVMFPEPLSMETTPTGLMLGYFGGVNNNGTWFNKPFQNDLTLGVAGLNAAAINVSAFTDWTADFNFGPITTRVGRGMPFVYAFTNGSSPTVTFSGTPTVFTNNGNILGVSIGSNNYGLFCPAGGTWTGIGGTTLTCHPPAGHNYFSLAILPSPAALADFSAVAFSFPTNTQATWSYNQASSQVTSTYTVTTQAMEGASTGFLTALYPHHYTSLQGTINTAYTYASARGTLKVLKTTSFSTLDTYHGVIPFLPSTGNYGTTQLQSFLDTVATEANHFGANDTYTLGKQFNRIAQLLPIAHVNNSTADFNNFLSGIETKMADWFTAAGKSSDLFQYNSNWGTLIGYPASFGSDTALNDHHFHYGYWIHSAALIGLFDPNWISSTRYGPMVSLLGRDIATPTRGDSMFPFLRHFDVYAGHSWASGQAPFGDGVNEESSSEAVNAWVGLILYATETGNTQLRDTAIWLYTLETNSVFDYWFNDGPVATFPSGFTRVAVANLFDAKSDTGTFFGAQPEFEHGIEFLPFTGGSFYLGRDPAYCQRNIAEVNSLDGGSFNTGGTNWPDLMEEYEAFYDPTTAINQWNSTSFVFDGESKAHEYYWLQNLQALGRVDQTVTANTPLYAVFKTTAGIRTHTAFNTGTAAITVTFSDGVNLNVPAGSLATDGGSTGTGGGGVPAAPASLGATAVSSSQINLSWAASATAGVTYSVFRSTTSGFAPAAGNQIASGITVTNFSNTGLTASTTYFYKVEAVNSAGASAPSPQASATTPAGGGAGGPISINAGGGAAGVFGADTDFAGGTASSTTAVINTALIPAPVPPQAVYQTERWGAFTYTMGGFTPGSAHTVQLHFAEIFWSAAGQRKFNILINGAQVLTNFDIIANTGAMNKAIEENFSATANSSGQIVVQFTVGAADQPKVSGIVIQ
jgi:endoglucanase Acf2